MLRSITAVRRVEKGGGGRRGGVEHSRVMYGSGNVTVSSGTNTRLTRIDTAEEVERAVGEIPRPQLAAGNGEDAALAVAEEN